MSTIVSRNVSGGIRSRRSIVISQIPHDTGAVAIRRPFIGRPSLDDLGEVDPALLGGCSLERFTDGLDACALLEVRIPRAVRPSREQVGRLIDEARAVADALTDRPPVAGLRVA